MQALIHQTIEPLVSASQVPFVVSVSAFETGGFKSPVLRRNNNLFGMKLPNIRATTAVGDVGGYAYYNSFEDSITDFYLWYDFTNMKRQLSLYAFVQQMKARKYFEADFDHYYNGCKTWFEKLY